MTTDECHLVALLGIAALGNPNLPPALREEIITLLDRTVPNWRFVSAVISDPGGIHIQFKV